jgi:prepilin-type processing-associated H-X9-DG protein
MMAGRSRSRTGLTLVELIALIAVAGILVAILLPVIVTSRMPGCRPSCISHLKRLDMAISMYAQDYDECYPSIRPNAKNDWRISLRSADGQGARFIHGVSPWVAQLFPYVASPYSLRCPQEPSPASNQPSIPGRDSAANFRVSYGPNLMFLDPAAYGRKRPVTQSTVDEPGEMYLFGDCVDASGFDLDTIAYLRYPNYDPTLHPNGWSLDQFTAAGRVARPEREAEGLTRHQWGSNVLFADGHVKWLRHDQIPNNDRPDGKQFRELERHVVPWK